MAPSIVGGGVVQGETFLPGKIFVFGGFVLRANSSGHLEQIDSYAPGHQVRFRSLNYVADIRGDLIFDGFETATTAPLRPVEHGLNLSSGRIQEIAPVTTPALDPEQITGATESAVLEPRADPTSYDTCINRTPDSSPISSSEPCELADTELDHLSMFKFSAADVFQHSPMGDLLSSLKNLSLADGSSPNYVRFDLTADDGEFCFPPATHFIATVEDPTNTPDPRSEDIAGMDEDEGQGQSFLPARHGMATS